MCFVRNSGGAFCSPNRLGCNLGNCFRRYTRCNPGMDCLTRFRPICVNRCLIPFAEVCSPAKRKRNPNREGELRGMSHRDYWYDQNSNIIKALGRALNLHGDVIFEFLYALTLQNFARVLHPQGKGWNNCRVPLSNFDTCDYYMGIFDCNGNVRHPYHPGSLLKLLSVMQLVLKQEKQPKSPIPITIKSADEKKSIKDKRIADKAGFGPDSVARANGLRRRYRMGEKYRLEGFRGQLNPELGGTTWNSYSKSFAQIFGPLANKLETSGGPKTNNGNSQVVGNATNVFCETDAPLSRGEDPSKEREERRLLNQLLYGENIEALIKECEFSDSLRCQELKCLLSNVKQQTSMQSDLNSLISALKDMDLNMAAMDENALNRRLNNKLSNDYNRITTRAQTMSYGLPVRKAGNDADDEVPSIELDDKGQLGRRVRKRPPVPPLKPVKVNYYYGEQIPVLSHQPFDPNAPSSWMRRHPKPSRMNEMNEIVETGEIHRYKRATVQRQFDQARMRQSVRSVYSSSDRLADIQPEKKKKREATSLSETISS